MFVESKGVRFVSTAGFWQSRKERRLYELREKAIRGEVSALAGAGAEGEAGGKVAMAREAICKYLDHQTACRILIEGDGRTMPYHFAPEVLRAFQKIAGRFEEVYETLATRDGGG